MKPKSLRELNKLQKKIKKVPEYLGAMPGGVYEGFTPIKKKAKYTWEMKDFPAPVQEWMKTLPLVKPRKKYHKAKKGTVEKYAGILTRPVDLHLTRKDAENLNTICYAFIPISLVDDLTVTANRVIRKLKRAGVK